MKNNLLCFVFLFATASCFAQFGVKAGLNFNSNGELREIVTVGENIIEDSEQSPHKDPDDEVAMEYTVDRSDVKGSK